MEGVSPETLRASLSLIAKKWAFQGEEGSQGYRHYQGRVSLKRKARKAQVISLFHSLAGLGTAHISLTSSENKENVFYVIKGETRITGPWTDQDEVIVIPKQYSDSFLGNLHPWQQSIIELVKPFETDTVHYVYNPKGGVGKSTLVGYLACRKLASKLPFCNDFKDLMRMVCDKPVSKCYLIDLPRGITADGRRLSSMYAGIEELKGGYAYDDRYKFREKWFDAPQVVVFANHPPDMTLLSGRRWKLWTVTDNLELSRWESEADCVL